MWQPAWTGRPTEDVEASAARSTSHFQKALAKFGATYYPGLVRTNGELIAGGKITSQTHQEQGYRAAIEVLSPGSAQHPDGIIIVDDMMTHGALVAMNKLKLHPGEDLRIATNANKGSSVLLGREDNLIMIESDPAEVVATMFSLLDTLMSGRKPDSLLNIVRPRLRQGRRGDEVEIWEERGSAA